MSEKPKRTPEEEAALDRKIAEIRQRNKEIEERRKVIEDEAKQYVAPKSVTLKGAPVQPQESAKTSHDEPSTARPKAKRQPQAKWDREWDSGKQPAANWKMNVPEYGDEGCRPFRNAYAPNRTRRLNGSHIGRAGNAPRLDGNVGHTKRVAAGARRQEAQLRNPAFFHDDRFPNGESKRTDANDIDNGKLPAAIEGKKIASRVTMRPSNSAAS
ncbi:Protein C10G8.8 a, partial [Aphelenchoides avenae]